ncbi:MAG: exopolysaccharide biosynthesis protein [Neomegalonema sp.]|nr:exopolysaccharide biosynthesis protein [Neomegalonema sp.]
MTSKTRTSKTHDLENILDDLDEKAQQQSDQLSVGTTLDAFAERSFGAMVTIIALVAALPLVGGIPGMSAITGALILLVAIQYLIGHDHIWVPQRLRDLSIKAETLRKAIEKTRPYAARVDAVIKPRLQVVVDGPIARSAIAVAAIALAITFFPMEVVPFGVMVPALSVLALGLALVGRDGVLALVGLGGAVLTLYTLYAGLL